MGSISEHIRRFIQTHLEKHGLVVWYDPEKRYGSLLESGWNGVKVLRGTPESLLRLRYEADSTLEAGSTSERLGENFPPLLVYLPFSREETGYALIELETAGVTLFPGASIDPRSDLPRDTSLTALAREALKDVLPQAELERVLDDVAAGKLDLGELDKMVQPVEISPALRSLYNVQTPEELLLAFITDESRDPDLEARKLLDDLSDFFSESLFKDSQGSPQRLQEVKRLRQSIITYCLVTEAAVCSGVADEKPWYGQPVLENSQARALVANVMQRWRRDRNLEKIYVHWADTVEEQLHLQDVWNRLSVEALVSIETFRGVDIFLQERLVDQLAKNGRDAETRDQIRALAQERQKGFWWATVANRQPAWEMLLAAVEVLEQVATIRAETGKGRAWQVVELVQRYAAPEGGWYCLDGAYRRFEILRGDDALQSSKPSPALTRLTSTVRRTYREAVHRLSERLVKAWERGRLGEGLLLQREIFPCQVWPQVQDRLRVAYVWVDALRYELMAELLSLLRETEREWQSATLQPALGVLPSITPLGMAALLPGANGSLGLLSQKGDLVAEVDGRLLRTREDRIEYLKTYFANVGRHFQALSLDALVEATDRDLERLREVDVLVVTSGEIDQIAENASPREAQSQFQSILRLLRRAVYRLAEDGFAQVVITADHGFLLFGDAVDEGEKIDPPAGNAVKVGRRYWIGQGGRATSAYIYFTAADLELIGDLEFAFPRGAGVFRAPGGHTHYYHGGISLQELVVPVLVLNLQDAAQAGLAAGGVVWTLELGSSTITSKVFRVTIRAEARDLFAAEQKVRLEVLANGEQVRRRTQVLENEYVRYNEVLDEIILTPIEGGGGYPPCDVTLVFTSELPKQGELALSLVDAVTGQRLAGPVRCPVDIAIR